MGPAWATITSSRSVWTKLQDPIWKKQQQKPNQYPPKINIYGEKSTSLETKQCISPYPIQRGMLTGDEEHLTKGTGWGGGRVALRIL